MVREHIFKNGLKLIYKESISNLSSICIGVNAGACVEGEILGLAHATEHLIYKGSKKRSEEEINRELTEIFGFQNAMTNFPYVIYYGTLLMEDLGTGLDLFSDILLNPSFSEDGFKEEMDVIKEELKEWDEDIEQYCEDKLFLNAFSNRRIKYPIIGEEKSLEKITIEDVREFYNKHYHPKNTYISIVSKESFHYVVSLVEKSFENWSSNSEYNYETNYESPKLGEFSASREGGNSSRVEIIAPIDYISERELKCLRIFNEYFGIGVNSVLYDVLRTKNALVYDVISKIANEGNLKFYKIEFSTGKENLSRALDLIKECIKELDNKDFSEKEIEKLCKSLKLKRLFREEQSIVLAKELSTYGVMFGHGKKYFEEIEGLEELGSNEIINVGKKVLEKLSIQIINPR